MDKAKVGILLGIMCMLLTIGICVQIKTVNSTSTGVGKTQTENELRNSVLKWKERYESIYKEEEKKEKQLEELRAKVASQDTDAVNLSAELEKENTLLGYNEVSRSRADYHCKRCYCFYRERKGRKLHCS